LLDKDSSPLCRAHFCRKILGGFPFFLPPAPPSFSKFCFFPLHSGNGLRAARGGMSCTLFPRKQTRRSAFSLSGSFFSSPPVALSPRVGLANDCHRPLFPFSCRRGRRSHHRFSSFRFFLGDRSNRFFLTAKRSASVVAPFFFPLCSSSAPPMPMKSS